MASTEQVRQYLAYWFQLGKPIKAHHGETLLPKTVLQSDRYSSEFEQCWQQIEANPDRYHLDGAEATIGELLSSGWEVVSCARCDMPIPMLPVGTQLLECPCFDLPFWPDSELPKPRSPVNNRNQLDSIRDRLTKAGDRANLS